MSDGHFNKALLPRTDFQSGLRTGISRTRQIAIRALEKALTSSIPPLTEEQIQSINQQFTIQFNELLK